MPEAEFYARDYAPLQRYFARLSLGGTIAAPAVTSRGRARPRAIRDPRAEVGTEPRVRPGQHPGGFLLLEPALAHEPREHRAPPGFLQHRRVVRWQRDEGAVGPERAVGQEHMEVGVQVGERAEGLDAEDRAEHGVALAAGGLEVATQRAVGPWPKLPSRRRSCRK